MNTRILLFPLLIACSLSLQATPDWQMNPSTLGSASLEGDLAIALPMGPVPAAPEFRLPLQLVHGTTKTKTTEHAQYTRRNLMRKQAGIALLPPKEPLKKGETDPKTTIYRSGWSIPQLVSYLYPANRDRLVWQSPSGGRGRISPRRHGGDAAPVHAEGLALQGTRSGTLPG
jgi:hypothetical protein